MSQHPLNLSLRFFLEMSALAVYGGWAWAHTPPPLHLFTGLGLPVVVAFLWTVLRSREPEDPAEAPPGRISPVTRLVLEALIFGLAILGLADIGAFRATWFFSGLLLLHYMLSYDRVAWMLKH